MTIHQIGGSWSSGTLYYDDEEKNLYVVNKTGKNGTIYLACYETITGKKKERKEVMEYAPCSARRQLESKNAKSWKNSKCCHTEHYDDHAILYRNFLSLNEMKKQCRFFAEHFPLSTAKIPIKDIFLMEMSKYVFCMLKFFATHYPNE